MPIDDFLWGPACTLSQHSCLFLKDLQCSQFTILDVDFFLPTAFGTQSLSMDGMLWRKSHHNCGEGNQ